MTAAARAQQPHLWVFNPSAEAEAARGAPGYCPPSSIQALRADLDCLPMFFANAARGDAVWTDVDPAGAWLDALVASGLALPTFVRGPEPAKVPSPWGWSPDVARLMQTSDHWIPAWRELYAKDTWLAACAELCETLQGPIPEVIGASDVGVAAASLAEVTAALARIEGPAVIKAAFGTAGRGAMRLDALDDHARRFVAGALELGRVVVEPWRERVDDLSLQLSVHGDALEVDVTRFWADSRGRYLGPLLGPWPASPRISDLLSRIAEHRHQIAAPVARVLRSARYEGPASVDMMVFDDRGTLRLKPLLEVNPRFTMGRLGQALSALIAPGSVGHWRLYTRSDAKRAKADGFVGLCQRARSHLPTQRDASGRLIRGALATNDPTLAIACVGVLWVAEQPADIPTRPTELAP